MSLLFDHQRGAGGSSETEIVLSDTAPTATLKLWRRTTGVQKLFAYTTTFWEAQEQIPIYGNRAGSSSSTQYAGYDRIAAGNQDTKAWRLPFPALITDITDHSAVAVNTANNLALYVDGALAVSYSWAGATWIHTQPNFLVTAAAQPIMMRSVFASLAAWTDWKTVVYYREVVIP